MKEQMTDQEITQFIKKAGNDYARVLLMTAKRIGASKVAVTGEFAGREDSWSYDFVVQKKVDAKEEKPLNQQMAKKMKKEKKEKSESKKSEKKEAASKKKC